MFDGHVHLERGPLTVEYALQFVDEAAAKGITHLQILDHAHRFKEFEPIYENIKCIQPQVDFLAHDLRNSIDEYLHLIEEMRKLDLPIDVTYGLEVCYSPNMEESIRQVLSKYKFDFLVGSVHSMFNLVYDSSWSIEYLWDKYSTDDIYKEYYHNLAKCIESDLFTQIGHPDTLKMFNRYPDYDLKETYHKIARLANEHNVLLENNVGCYYRYNHHDKGLADDILDIFKEHNCKIITVSDAHRPQDVGNFIKDIQERTYGPTSLYLDKISK